MRFSKQHKLAVQDLSDILDFDVTAHPESRHFPKMVAHSLILHQQGKAIARVELAKLRFMTQQLRQIKEINPEAFRRFRRALMEFNGAQEYIGLRAEIYVAAHMGKRRKQYVKRESPDFEFARGEKLVYMECGSAHSSVERESSDTYKVGAAIRAKGRKSYASRDTALFLDINHVAFANSIKGFDRPGEIDSEVSREVEPSGFGSVLVSWYAHNPRTDMFELHYIRFDSDHIAPELRQLLDETFSMVDVLPPGLPYTVTPIS